MSSQCESIISENKIIGNDHFARETWCNQPRIHSHTDITLLARHCSHLATLLTLIPLARPPESLLQLHPRLAKRLQTLTRFEDAVCEDKCRVGQWRRGNNRRGKFIVPHSNSDSNNTHVFSPPRHMPVPCAYDEGALFARLQGARTWLWLINRSSS